MEKQLPNWLAAITGRFIDRWKNLPRPMQWTLLGAAGLLCILIGWGLSAQGPQIDQANTTMLAMDVFIKLSVVLALIWVSSLVLKRWKWGTFQKSERKLAVIESLMLTPKRSLLLVKAGDKVLLLGATDQAVTLISDLGAAENLLAHSEITPSFSDVLEQAALEPALELEPGTGD